MFRVGARIAGQRMQEKHRRRRMAAGQRGGTDGTVPKHNRNSVDAPTMRRSQSGKRWFILVMPYGGQARSLAAPKD